MRIAGLLISVALIACSSPRDSDRDETTPRRDAGVGDAGFLDGGVQESDGGTEESDGGFVLPGYVTLRGTVQYHPQELRWRFAQGGALATPPSLAGCKLNVEDAIKAQSKLPPLKTVDVVTEGAHPTTGTFVAQYVDVKRTTLALEASIERPGDPDWIVSSYGLGTPPFEAEMNDLPVYVVSKAFLTHLADVLERDLPTMLDEGIVLGAASNWSHSEGISGAKTIRLYGTGTSARIEEITEGIFYLSDDLSTKVDQRATTASGFWIRLNAGSASTYSMLDKDATRYMEEGRRLFNARLVGSRAGVVVSVFFEDLATKPSP
jgi:hypothetical protein